MSTISLRLPDSLHHRVKQLSKTDRVSINQFVTTALAEKLSALGAQDYLKKRAKRGSAKKYLAVLSKIKSGKENPEDE